MHSWLKRALLVWIAACQVYLFAHSQEPLRLDVGDPWSDANVLCSINYVKHYGFLETSFTDILDVGPLTKESYRYTHYPPLAEITYGAIGKYLGVSSIGTYRLFALVFAAGAMWFLFAYLRRLYGETIALIATALWQGSLMWLLYADSIHQAPIFQLMTFFGLWGLERAIATRERRFYLAAFAGALGCFLTAYDGWIFFPAAVLYTVYAKAGNPFARGNRHFVAVCAAGCVAAFAIKALFVIGAVGWTEFVSDLRFQFIERSSSTFDRELGSALPTMTRRLTQAYSPLIWLAIAFHVVKLVRATSWSSALRETAGWLLLCGVAFLYVFPELAASQLLPSQVLLPFYAVGTAMIVERLLGGAVVLRVLGHAWLAFAAVWGAWFMIGIPRAVMPEDQVREVRAYLAQHDHNDFVVDNLMAIGQIQWGFDRHHLSIYSGKADEPGDDHDAQLYMCGLFSQTNTEEITAIFFKDPYALYVDKSLWPLALPAHTWSVIGAPYMWHDKARSIIAEVYRRELAGLAAVGATRVLELPDIDVYRIRRSEVVDRLYAAAQAESLFDMTGVSGARARLLGWSNGVVGWPQCELAQGMPCRTVLTKRGIRFLDTQLVRKAAIMLRVPASCDLELRIRLREPAVLSIEIDGLRQRFGLGDDIRTTIPSAKVHPGVNVLTFDATENFLTNWASRGVYVTTVQIEACVAPPPQSR